MNRGTVIIPISASCKNKAPNRIITAGPRTINASKDPITRLICIVPSESTISNMVQRLYKFPLTIFTVYHENGAPVFSVY